MLRVDCQKLIERRDRKHDEKFKWVFLTITNPIELRKSLMYQSFLHKKLNRILFLILFNILENNFLISTQLISTISCTYFELVPHPETKNTIN